MNEAQSRQTILIVDDVQENLALLNEILSEEYNIIAALNGKKALQQANNSPRPDLILLDVLMPAIDGHEVCQQLKKDDKTKNIPVIFITALHDDNSEEKCFQAGGIDFISKPIRPIVLQARVKNHLHLSSQKNLLETQVRERTASLEMSHLRILHNLSTIVNFSDEGKGFHLLRMSHYAFLISQAMGMDLKWCDTLYNATPLHDIGNVWLPDSLLSKPGKLTLDERKTMQTHCQNGYELLSSSDDSDILNMASSIALSHHEKYDGTGYPFSLSGDDIKIEGRILAIIDVFEALTSERPYKEISSDDEAFEIIASESGKHFDPQIVSVFLEHRVEILNIKQRFSDDT